MTGPMILIDSTTTVSRPPDEVFDFVAAHYVDHVGRWNPKIVEVTTLTAGAFAAGTRVREVQLIRGKRQTHEFEVVEFSPPRRFALRGLPGSGTGETHFLARYDIVADPAGARLDHHLELDWQTGWFRFAPALVRHFVRRELAAAIRTLKAEVERAGRAAGQQPV